jgi:hypothetical protein
MEPIQEIYVLLEDKPGTIGKLTRILKKKRISIYGIGLFIDTARIHVSHPEKALETLLENNFQVELHPVLRIVLPNKQGAMAEMTQKLGNAGININYLYGAMLEKQKRGVVVLEVDKPELAIDIFRNHRF